MVYFHGTKHQKAVNKRDSGIWSGMCPQSYYVYQVTPYDLKRKSDMLFSDLGTDTTTAIRMFLTQAVANNGFPFEIKKKTGQDMIHMKQ